MDDYNIYGIIILVIVLILVWSIYSLNKEIVNVDKKVDIGTSLLNANVYEVCPVGYCPTNIISGIKRCPNNDKTQLAYDVGLEVCNPKYFCTAKETPYALKSTGDVDIGGVCEVNLPCRCVSEKKSPYYSTTVFSLKDGYDYNQISSYGNYYLEQNPIHPFDIAYTNVPISSTDFYQLNPSVTNRIVGGCDFFKEDSQEIGGIPNHYNMALCTNKNPCIYGAFSYNIDDKDPRKFCNLIYNKFYLDEPAIYTLGCSLGSGCSLDEPQDKFFPDYDTDAINLNLYYPIFNRNTYRQECIRCFPGIKVEIKLDSSNKIITQQVFDGENTYESIPILYSGKDFAIFKPVFGLEPYSGAELFTPIRNIHNQIIAILPIAYPSLSPSIQYFLRIRSLTDWESSPFPS